MTQKLIAYESDEFVLNINEFTLDEFGRFELSEVAWLEEIGGGQNQGCSNTGCRNTGCSSGPSVSRSGIGF